MLVSVANVPANQLRFDIPPHLSPKQKAELVITDLRDRMEVYHQMRKLKTTTQMEDRVTSLRQSSQSSTRENTSSPGLSSFREPEHLQGASMVHTWAGRPPANFSPPPPVLTDSSGGDSRQGSVVGTSGDVQMGAMEEIDWVSVNSSPIMITC